MIHTRYDAWNRLMEVRADDSGEPGDLLATYEYDGRNRRVEKIVTQAGGGPSEAHYYYNQNWQLLEQRFLDPQKQLTASNQYVWSAHYIDAPVMRFHDGNGDGDCLDLADNIRYYTADANFTVTATIDAWTGDVVERYVYTAYGTATVYDDDWSNPAAPMTDAPFYCGYFFDSETGLYQVRNRYYDTSLCFISRDPIGFEGKDFNLYRYGADRPTSTVDPLGRQGWDCLPGATYCPPEYFPPTVRVPLPASPPPAPPLVPPSLGFLWDFLTGGGDDVRCYCTNEVQLEEMKKSPGAEKLRRAFYRNCGRDTWDV
ncbi:MAG: RHS repeat-associated core domain-containing protein, partial [Armatimonadia bacterium]